MKLAITTVCFLFISISSIFSQVADTVGINTIIQKTENFTTRFPQEKIHLHFDKPYYAVGDTMWFKAYVTTGINILTPLSKIVYIDIVSSRDTLIQSIKLPVTSGLAWGSIPLDPKYYRQGNYHIKAYTRWMMNFEPDYFFSKSVSVGDGENLVSTHISYSELSSGQNAKIVFKNPSGSAYAQNRVNWSIETGGKQLSGKGSTDMYGVLNITIPKLENVVQPILTTQIDVNGKLVSKAFILKHKNNDIDLQFFPEGGKMVNGIPVRVAFKALNAQGLGVDVKGSIIDNEGVSVVEFASEHLGMGSFYIVPKEGKTYTASVGSPTLSKKYPLPQAANSGINIAVTNTAANNNFGVRVVCNDVYFAENQNRSYYLLARSGGKVYFAAKMGLQKQVISASIPKDNFPPGIVQIAVLSDKGEPLNERLVFNPGNEDFSIAAKTEKPVYAKRQKVRLSIASRLNKLPNEANLSVAVTDESKVPYDDDQEKTIFSNLLLTSDLKGFIERPNYYFNRRTEKTASDLDVLMLTQGYRRYDYTSILNDKFPPLYFLPEQGIEITGILRNSTGMPLNKANVKLRIPDRYYTAFAITNGSGVFKFPNVVVTDSSEVIVSSADYSNKNPMLTVDPLAIQPAFSNVSTPDEQPNIDSAMNKYLQNNQQILKRSRVLKEVVITSSSPKVAAPSHMDYGNLSSLSAWPDHLISTDRLANCPSFFICMQTMLTGVTYQNENFYVSRDFNAGNKVPMQVFYNGMPVDVSFLNGINSAEIESVEIFLRDQLGLVNRTYNTNGALVINGKRVEKVAKMKLEDIRNLLPKPGEIKFRPQGYTVSREFYSPKYLTPASITQGMDLRSTIYWDPKVKTDKVTGNTLVEFYNADGKGNYKVVIEGLDNEGHIARSVFRYKVE